ncbi:HAL/PAL/TAL family ammonia-lyase [Paracoccus marinaquae]|nr:histidine ammonia-lyase [Paracoccus marinaquae]
MSGDGPIAWQDIVKVARHGADLQLTEVAWARIRRARRAVLEIADSGRPSYGINTGLGALCDIVLDRDELHRLSRHTLRSHACGVGEDLRAEQVRAIIAAAVINYSHGHSGIDESIVSGLLALLEHDILPNVPAGGSVGYLTHMAHIGLALIGEGEVDMKCQRMPARQALASVGLQPVTLGPKDGLSLVNGTPAMTGLACLALADAERVAGWADVTAALSFEALGGQIDAFDPVVISLKKHPGMQESAGRLRSLLAGSQQIAGSRGRRLQDALSLRSIPHVHGACRDQLAHAARQIEAELNSATDNPLVVEMGGRFRVMSQSNCHGESVAMACDLLCIAAAELGSISERRSFRLVTPQTSELPAFLTGDGGVKSGMMIAQYTAASLVADNRRLAVPAVTDNFMTSGLQEDHVSLGESAALKLDQALRNTLQVLAIEYLVAAQALEFVDARPLGRGTARAVALLREQVAAYEEDHPLFLDFRAAAAMMRDSDAKVFWDEEVSAFS